MEEKPVTITIPDSVHERNLYIFSLPVIFVFNILRSLLYLFFVIIRYVWKSTSKLFIFKTIHTKVENRTASIIDLTETDCQVYTNQMALYKGKNTATTGSVDPLLAKQKDHHRKAFEFISKALKIDEENEGNGFNYVYIK